MVTADEFKQVMRRWASTVTVVTTRAADGLHGLTATAFSSLSAQPPLILVCVNKATRSHDFIAESGIFCVNFLTPEMKEISDRFAGRLSPEERFAGLEHGVEVTGAPVLRGALAFLDCRVAQAVASGDHTIYIGQVEAAGVRHPDASPLLYFHGHYHKLGEAL